MALIGSWQQGDPPPQLIPELPEWARAHGIDAAIWTALKARFNGKEAAPSAEEVIEYLRKLTGPARVNAERYVRWAPRQIDTEYRRKIEAELGWTHRECRPFET